MMREVWLVPCVLVMAAFGCSPSTPQFAYEVHSDAGFHDGTAVISEGMSQKAVTALLGPPERIISQNEYSLNNRLKAAEIWCYWRPGFATIQFIVAFREGKVSSTHIWDTLAWYSDGTLSTVKAYWEEVGPWEEACRRRDTEEAGHSADGAPSGANGGTMPATSGSSSPR
jgi:hypothetical protein